MPGDLQPDLDELAHLVVLRGKNVGKTYPVTGPEMVIGRAATADLRLDDEGVSRVHCRIRHVNNTIVLEDMGSRNGTWCNGERVAEGPRELFEGDRLQIGTQSVLRFTLIEGDINARTMDEQPGPILDPLTGCFSRRHFMDQLKIEVNLTLERKSALSLMLIHIDRYDMIGQKQSAELRDQITARVATKIRENLRANKDLLARMERGDFGVLSRAASPGDTFMLAERFRASAAGVPAVDKIGPVTLSFGIASVHELEIKSAHDLMVAAGIGLNRARSQGGNRVVLCTQELLQEQQTHSKV